MIPTHKEHDKEVAHTESIVMLINLIVCLVTLAGLSFFFKHL